MVYGTIASSTVTVAIVSSCRCGFVTRIRISPGLNSTRRMSNWSAGGGARPTRSSSVVPLAAKIATAPRAATGVEAPTGASRAGAPARPSPSVDDLEEPHPAELGELGLVGVEHEPAGVGEVDLDDPALALAEHDGVRVLEVVAGARRVVAEEIAV